jgi:hypothetical protein
MKASDRKFYRNQNLGLVEPRLILNSKGENWRGTVCWRFQPTDNSKNNKPYI